MGKVKEIGGFVRATLDKLPDIRADLVRPDDDWQEWGFPELIESLRKWCSRNPIPRRDQMPSTPDPSINSPPNRGPPIRDSSTQNLSYRHSRNRIHQRKTLPTKPRMKVRRWHVSVSIVMEKNIALQSVRSSLASLSAGGF